MLSGAINFKQKYRKHSDAFLLYNPMRQQVRRVQDRIETCFIFLFCERRTSCAYSYL